VETFVRKTKSNEWLLRKKTFSYAFYLHIHSIYNRSYGWDALQNTEAFRKNESRLHASWLTKTFRMHTQKHKGLKDVPFPYLNDTAIIY
jgi:hypothetical protein